MKAECDSCGISDAWLQTIEGRHVCADCVYTDGRSVCTLCDGSGDIPVSVSDPPHKWQVCDACGGKGWTRSAAALAVVVEPKTPQRRHPVDQEEREARIDAICAMVFTPPPATVEQFEAAFLEMAKTGVGFYSVIEGFKIKASDVWLDEAAIAKMEGDS